MKNKIIDKTNLQLPYIKKVFEKVIIVIIILAMVLSISVIFLHSPFSKVFPWMDSSAFLYMGKAMLNEKIIYIDIFDHKGPFMFILQAIGMLLSEKFGVWIIEILSLFIFYFMIYKTLNIIFNKKIAILSLLTLTIFAPFYTNIGNYTETFSLALIAISLYIFLKYLSEKDNGITIFYSVITGITLMLTLLIRLNNAIMWVIFCPLMFFYYIFTKRYKNALKLFIGVMTGMLIVFIPFAIYFSVFNVWSEFFFQYITLNLKYIGGGNKIESMFFFLETPATILVLLPLLFLLFKEIREQIKKNYLLFISSYVYYILTFLCVILSGFEYPHYGILFFPCYAINFGYLYYFFHLIIEKYIKENSISKLYIINMLILILALCVCLFQNNIFYYYKNHWYVFSNKNARSELYELAEVIRENTKAEDEIIVFGNYPELYLVSERYSSSKYFQLNWSSFSENKKIVNEFLSDLRSDKTKLFVINKNFMDNKFKSVLEDKYNLIFTTNDGYEIYKRLGDNNG